MKTNDEKFWVTDFNHLDDIKSLCDLPEHVHIHDLTLREGDQTPGCVLNAEEKIEIAKDLDALGVNAIEMFAIVSGDDRKALIELSKPGVLKHAKLASLSRALPQDIDAVAACGVKRICIEGPGNFWTAKNAIKQEPEQIIESFVNAVKYAKSVGMEEIAIGPWDCARGTTMEFLKEIIERSVEAGATEVCYADSFGFTLPWTVQHMVRKYREWAGKDVVVSVHFHNDFGLATANTLAAVAAGASSVQVAMNGLGERFGNTPLDEVAVNLALNMNVKTDIQLEKLYPLSKKIEAMSKVKIAANKPVVGERGFMMGSGLVVDMLSKAEKFGMAKAFFPYTPELIGRPSYSVVYGKGVGSNMVGTLAESMGFEITEDQKRELTEMIKHESLVIKDLVPEYRVQAMIKEYLNK